ATPASGPRPLARSAPDVGKLLAMMISPLSPPPPPVDAGVQATTSVRLARIAAAESQRLCMSSSHFAISLRGPFAFPLRVAGPRLTVERRRRPSRRQSRAVPACDREGQRPLVVRAPAATRRRVLSHRGALPHRLVPRLAALRSHLCERSAPVTEPRPEHGGGRSNGTDASGSARAAVRRAWLRRRDPQRHRTRADRRHRREPLRSFRGRHADQRAGRPDPALRSRARKVLGRLAKANPDWGPTLRFSSPLELLVATILAAQAQDERINEVTRILFTKYRSPADYAAAPAGVLERDIKA